MHANQWFTFEKTLVKADRFELCIDVIDKCFMID